MAAKRNAVAKATSLTRSSRDGPSSKSQKLCIWRSPDILLETAAQCHRAAPQAPHRTSRLFRPKGERDWWANINSSQQMVKPRWTSKRARGVSVSTRACHCDTQQKKCALTCPHFHIMFLCCSASAGSGSLSTLSPFDLFGDLRSGLSMFLSSVSWNLSLAR